MSAARWRLGKPDTTAPSLDYKADYMVKSFPEVWVNHLGARQRDVNADLLHCGYRVRVQAARLVSCAYDFELVAR
jgi:hypothetical protein